MAFSTFEYIPINHIANGKLSPKTSPLKSCKDTLFSSEKNRIGIGIGVGFKAENVYIDEVKGVEILLDLSEVGNYFQQLKNLHIQYIIKGNNVLLLKQQRSTFISPPETALFNQKKLIGFFHEDYTVDFPALKILEIENSLDLKAFIHKSIDKDNPTGGVLFNEK
ncbi:hypothetical protein Godav_028560, partial [Gossypium davidsonii]|nr:hypothetical protein [Gossypium davidsonii]